MVGLIGDGLATSTQPVSLDDFVAPTADVIGSMFGGFLAELPTVKLGRAINRGTLDPAGFGEANLYSSIPALPTPGVDGPPMLDAATANERYGIPGALEFKHPVSELVASDLSKARQEQAVRDDYIARRPTNVLTGQVAQLAYGFMAQLLDPVNLGLAMIPGVGAGRVGTALRIRMAEGAGGRMVADSAPGRIITEGVSGATAGAAGAAAMEPLHWAFDQQDHED